MSPERWASVKAILDSVLSIAPDEREKYLANACAGDSSLRSEVESLLRAGQQSPDSFMKTGAARSMLARGAKLGGYEIVEIIGAGGMGEVYRARDVQLRREVAVKVLPPLFVLDADRLRRFEQEARAAAALNHPNILSVHHFGTHEGQPFIVSELLHGHSLREELMRDVPSLRKAIDYGVQLARGLAAAHEQGITHRDLKPENVFVTKDGQIKILDFGLAKLHRANWGQETDTSRATETGIVMGTLAYMSPEQVRGQEVSVRSDIFALGAILYELISGQAPFKKETAADTQSAILKEDPPSFAEAQVNAPPALERIARRCLEKLPERRFQSALDVEFALDAISGHSEVKSNGAIVASKSKHRGYIAWIAGLAVVVATLLILSLQRTPQATSQPLIRFMVAPPAKVSLSGVAVVSPNGEHVVFVGIDDTGKRQLWLRSLNSFSSQPLPGTDDAHLPFWSPDNNSIAFYTQDALKRLDLSGRLPQVLWRGSGLTGGAWNSNGVIVSSSADGILCRLAATGNEPKPITELDSSRKEVGHAYPSFLPDGDHFFYFAASTLPQNSGIYVASLSSSEKKRLLSGPGFGMVQYVAPGLLLFGRGDALMIQPFNLKKLELNGSPMKVAEPIWRTGPSLQASAVFSVSENGILVYRDPVYGANTELVWYDRTGKRLTTVADHAYFTSPYLSPDGKKLAVSVGYPGHRDIWVYDLTTGVKRRLTADPADDLSAVWSADGQRIFFTSDRRMQRELYQQKADEPKDADLVFSSPDQAVSIHDLSPDGRYAIYNPETQGVWVLQLFGEHKKQLLDDSGAIGSVRFAPNGHYIAYSSNESGRKEVYVRTFPDATGKWEISTDGGTEPMWRADGKELFYVTEGKLMSVKVSTGPKGFQASAPKALFEHPRLPTSIALRNRYVVTKDGQRFLFVVQPEPLAEGFNVVTNWMPQLRK